MKNIAWALSLPLLFTASLAAQSTGIIPAPGQPFPEVRLPAPNGQVATTRDLLGKRVVLHVFASW